MQDDNKVTGRITGEQFEPSVPDTMGWRLVYMVLIAVMMSLSQTILTAVTVIQFVIMILSRGTPNARLGDFGTDLGIWMAKAARYQTAASPVKPWPWTDLD